MAFKRRSIFDINRCEFQGRIVGDMVMEQVTKTDKSIVDRIKFTIVCNSNPYNAKSKYFVNMYAYGFMANAINVKFKTGAKVFAIVEYKPVAPSSKKQVVKEGREYEFEVKHLVLEALPTEPQDVETVDADDFEPRDIIMQKNIEHSDIDFAQ